MEEDHPEEDDEIHCLGDKGGASFLTQDAYEESLLSHQTSQDPNEESICQTNDQNRYNLRSKHSNGKQDEKSPPKKVFSPAKQQPNKDQAQTKNQVLLKALVQEVRNPDKVPFSFSFESEIQKVKIPIALMELMKNDAFKQTILKSLEPKPMTTVVDVINLQDDKPTIFLSPMVEDREETSQPFYVSLNIHDKILHNFLLDTRASHNLMPKEVMDELGLYITNSFHDLFSFEFRKVKCLGLIKDLAISLSQLPMRSMVMDIVVADVPLKFGILFSRAWIKRPGGTLQNDLSYATVPVFGGEQRRLYREA
jgi:hypothetical protein